MKRPLLPSVVKVSVKLHVLGGGVAQAIWSNPRILSSAFPRGSPSEIQTPGVVPGPG